MALELFTERGYDATSLREIAESLGITKAALYYHFDSKEAIIQGLFEARLSAIDELLEWAAEQPATPETKGEIFRRWIALSGEGGLRMIRFAVANQPLTRDRESSFDKRGLLDRVEQIYSLIADPESTLQEQLRVRMALLSITTAIMAAHGLEVRDGVRVDDEDLRAAATRSAAALVPAFFQNEGLCTPAHQA